MKAVPPLGPQVFAVVATLSSGGGAVNRVHATADHAAPAKGLGSHASIVRSAEVAARFGIQIVA